MGKAIVNMQSYKKGGTVKRTGLALVHKGEKVTSVKSLKMMKKGGKVCPTCGAKC